MGTVSYKKNTATIYKVLVINMFKKMAFSLLTFVLRRLLHTISFAGNDLQFLATNVMPFILG